jgi:hypothetical protein
MLSESSANLHEPDPLSPTVSTVSTVLTSADSINTISPARGAIMARCTPTLVEGDSRDGLIPRLLAETPESRSWVGEPEVETTQGSHSLDLCSPRSCKPSDSDPTPTERYFDVSPFTPMDAKSVKMNMDWVNIYVEMEGQTAVSAENFLTEVSASKGKVKGVGNCFQQGRIRIQRTGAATKTPLQQINLDRIKPGQEVTIERGVQFSLDTVEFLLVKDGKPPLKVQCQWL